MNDTQMTPHDRQDTAHASNRWRMWLIIGDSALVCLAVLLWYNPIWSVQSVTYEGPTQWEEMARDVVVLPADSNFVRVDVRLIEAEMQELFGDLAEVRVKLALPNILALRVLPVDVALWLGADDGLSIEGRVLNNVVGLRIDAPIWVGGAQSKKSVDSKQAALAVGSWYEVLGSDRRFGRIGSEWKYDRRTGWSLLMMDGATRIILGRTLLGDKAQAVSALLACTDCDLPFPSEIDLRVKGQMLIRPMNPAEYSSGSKEVAFHH